MAKSVFHLTNGDRLAMAKTNEERASVIYDLIEQFTNIGLIADNGVYIDDILKHLNKESEGKE